jgi:hypothetical protein
MNYASLGFAFLGLAFGLAAAYYWFKSAQVQPDPGWNGTLDEPVDPTDKNSDWTIGILDAYAKSAALNATAAKLTACAIVFGTAASVLGSLAAFK